MKKRKIAFRKLCGTGNDFIVIDNRLQSLPSFQTKLIANLCRRKTGIGADGLILIEKSTKADFSWRFFNPDGQEVEMCGNGARCAVQFFSEKIKKRDPSASPQDDSASPQDDSASLQDDSASPQDKIFFETRAGLIEARLNKNLVKIKLPPAKDLKINLSLELKKQTIEASFINTGVPHVVLETNDFKNIEKIAPQIRYHQQFSPQGTNVNFIKMLDNNIIKIKTYERGVEDFTLACGTGAVAAALIGHQKGKTSSPTTIIAEGGELKVHFDKQYQEIYLEGEVKTVFDGEFVMEDFL